MSDILKFDDFAFSNNCGYIVNEAKSGKMNNKSNDAIIDYSFFLDNLDNSVSMSGNSLSNRFKKIINKVNDANSLVVYEEMIKYLKKENKYKIENRKEYKFIFKKYIRKQINNEITDQEAIVSIGKDEILTKKNKEIAMAFYMIYIIVKNNSQRDADSATSEKEKKHSKKTKHNFIH